MFIFMVLYLGKRKTATDFAKYVSDVCVQAVSGRVPLLGNADETGKVYS